MRKFAVSSLVCGISLLLAACGESAGDRSSPGQGSAGDLWSRYGAAQASAEEAEFSGSVAQLAQMSDLVVVGRVVDASLGRVVDMYPDAPSARVQFIDYHIEVQRSSGAKTPLKLSFELPINVTSPELEAALDRAITPVDSNKDGEFDDAESAAATDDAAILAAFQEHWDDALDYTLSTVRTAIPRNDTLFFLRAVPTEGRFRPVNGDSVIVNDAGLAVDAWRLAADELEYPIKAEVAGRPFDEVVQGAFDAIR